MEARMKAEHTGIGRSSEDLSSVVLCMKKLKGKTNKQKQNKTDNMPTVNKEMTE